MPRDGMSSAKCLALDIGSSAMRLCELSRTATGLQVSKYYQREMLIDPSLDETARFRIRMSTLQGLLKDANAGARDAVFGMPGQSVFTRTRTLPPVPEQKIPHIVRYEIQQQLPFSLEQIAIDYQLLGRTSTGGYDVLMVAMKSDAAGEHLRLLQELKRRASVVDLTPLAAYNWLKHTGQLGHQGECVALLDLGAATTDMVIEREGQIRFIRAMTFGGNDITAAISQHFGVGFAEAERIKREGGMAPAGNPGGDGKCEEAIDKFLTRLASEVERTLAYFRSFPGGGTVSRVILTGGTALLPNIASYLERKLGIDVRLAQPLAGVTVCADAQDVNEHPEQASVVLGLALRSIQPVAIAINLIPPHIVRALRLRKQMLYGTISALMLALILAPVFVPWVRQAVYLWWKWLGPHLG